MHIECTNGTPTVDTLEHLPPLPLKVVYHIRSDYGGTIPREQDESGIYHALRLHDRVRYIHLHLPSSIFHKILVLMDEHFPILEHLSLSFGAEDSIPLTLPKAFLAPNLRHLTLPSISPPRRLRVLTSTVSLVTLVLSDIQTSSYFRPKLLVARLQFLPHLEKLFIEFSIPIPHPSTERELLGEQGAPVTLPSLKSLQFRGVGGYLESLIAQIRAPLLDQLDITLFDQITLELPHLFHFINITELFKLPVARVDFSYDHVFLIAAHYSSRWSRESFILRVKRKPLDWQINRAAQICHALIPALSGVEQLTLVYSPNFQVPAGLQNGAIDGRTWHKLLRSFIGLKELQIYNTLLEELSSALRVDEVGLDLGFLPNLRSITPGSNLFTSFIDARQVVGRPVKFSSW
jgi:hypothetical protein